MDLCVKSTAELTLKWLKSEKSCFSELKFCFQTKEQKTGKEGGAFASVGYIYTPWHTYGWIVVYSCTIAKHLEAGKRCYIHGSCSTETLFYFRSK